MIKYCIVGFCLQQGCKKQVATGLPDCIAFKIRLGYTKCAYPYTVVLTSLVCIQDKNKKLVCFRTGFIVLPVELTSGTYDIIPTTYRSGQEANFFLDISSSIPIKIGRIKWTGNGNKQCVKIPPEELNVSKIAEKAAKLNLNIIFGFILCVR